MIPKNAINLGETNLLGWAAKSTQLGSVIDAGGGRLQREVLPVSGAAATPTYNVAVLLGAKTIGTGAAGAKAPGIPGATPGVGAAAPNAGGTSIVFNAETTGTGTAEVWYLTADAPKDANNQPAAKLSDNVPGL